MTDRQEATTVAQRREPASRRFSPQRRVQRETSATNERCWPLVGGGDLPTAGRRDLDPEEHRGAEVRSRWTPGLAREPFWTVEPTPETDIAATVRRVERLLRTGRF